MLFFMPDAATPLLPTTPPICCRLPWYIDTPITIHDAALLMLLYCRCYDMLMVIDIARRRHIRVGATRRRVMMLLIC